MALLTTWSEANKVPLSGPQRIPRTLIFSLGGAIVRQYDCTEEWEWRGMDYTTAKACALAEARSSVTGGTLAEPEIVCTPSRSGESGAWKVHATSTYTTAWESITP